MFHQRARHGIRPAQIPHLVIKRTRAVGPCAQPPGRPEAGRGAPGSGTGCLGNRALPGSGGAQPACLRRRVVRGILGPRSAGRQRPVAPGGRFLLLEGASLPVKGRIPASPRAVLNVTPFQTAGTPVGERRVWQRGMSGSPGRRFHGQRSHLTVVSDKVGDGAHGAVCAIAPARLPGRAIIHQWLTMTVTNATSCSSSSSTSGILCWPSLTASPKSTGRPVPRRGETRRPPRQR
jgi:hypothetical protein